jgi:hypothetical protein
MDLLKSTEETYGYQANGDQEQHLLSPFRYTKKIFKIEKIINEAPRS